MPIYLQTKDVLNVLVSCFANYDTPANPISINLITWLKSEKHRSKIEALRKVGEKAKRSAIKASLPAITPSAQFTYRQESSMIAESHTRLIQFDVDLKDNTHIRNYADLKEQISKLPFVAYCALSASGKGYWGLVPIAYPKRHGQHFDALKRVFAYYKINIDTKPQNVASLRGYSFDPAPYLPKKVMLFELFDEPPKLKTRLFALTTDAGTERQRVEACISEISKRNIDITCGYNYWYAIGCDLASTFGEGGRDYFHVVSQVHPEYNPANCDRQYTHCLRSYKEVQLSVFFGRCRDNGISWKDLLPWESVERTTPLDTILKTSTQSIYKIYESTVKELPSESANQSQHDSLSNNPQATKNINTTKHIYPTVNPDKLLIVELVTRPAPELIRLPKTLESKWQQFGRPPLGWNKIAIHKALQRCLESDEQAVQTATAITTLDAVIKIVDSQVEDHNCGLAEWDVPSEPSAVPKLRMKSLHE